MHAVLQSTVKQKFDDVAVKCMGCAELGTQQWNFAVVGMLLGRLSCQRRDIRSRFPVRLVRVRRCEYVCLPPQIEDSSRNASKLNGAWEPSFGNQEAKDSELHFDSEPEHHCSLNAPANIRVVLNHRLYKQHRQGI